MMMLQHQTLIKFPNIKTCISWVANTRFLFIGHSNVIIRFCYALTSLIATATIRFTEVKNDRSSLIIKCNDAQCRIA